MNFIISDKDLLRLYTEESGPKHKSLPPTVIDRFFEAMMEITVASDERDVQENGAGTKRMRRMLQSQAERPI